MSSQMNHSARSLGMVFSAYTYKTFSCDVLANQIPRDSFLTGLVFLLLSHDEQH